MENGKWKMPIFRFFILHSPFSVFNSFALRLCVSAFILALISCGSKPTDLRTVIPADSLIYLETNDLGKALKAVTDNEAFKAAATTQPDFSALAGMKLAVAVTGFETKEQQVTEENSVLDFKPRFVAVAETNTWNYQALSFTENKLGEFINETYGGEVVLETADKYGGKYFTWTAQDGRKAYALVRGSMIFFGNDESAIEKCLAVMNGQAEGIAKNSKITALPADSLASGYVSPDGVAQIANIVGLKFASEAGEAPEVQTAIARILPQLLRNSITEVSWNATLTERGIEDEYKITTTPETAKIFAETFATGSASDQQKVANHTIVYQVPADFYAVSRYNLKDPQIAWRSILLVATNQMDSVSKSLISTFGEALFESYGIRDPEMFLSSLGDRKSRSSNIVTMKLGAESEDSVVSSMSGDYQLTQKSFIKNLKADWFGEDGYSGWSTKNGEVEVMFEEGLITFGSPGELKRLRLTRRGNRDSEILRQLDLSKAPITTIERDGESTSKIVDVLSQKNSENAKAVGTYYTETHFTLNGIERRTFSDFGLIGSIIEQLGKEN